MTATVDIISEDARWEDHVALFAPACTAALANVGLEPSAFEISVLA